MDKEGYLEEMKELKEKDDDNGSWGGNQGLLAVKRSCRKEMADRRWPLHKNKQEVFNSETVLCLKSTEEERKWTWEPRETGTKGGEKKENEIGLYVSDPQTEKRNPRRDKE